MIFQGTRTRALNQRTVAPDQGRQTRGFTRDLGLSKNTTGSFTFVNSTTSQIQGANGSFPNFAVNDQILVEGTNLNNGYKTITAVDSVNQAYLTVSPPPANEGPVTCTVRTS